MEEMRTRGTGVAIPGLNSTAVRELAVLLPSEPVLDAFDKYASPIVRRVFCACNESRTLAVLRDTLLPKLISGEIKIPHNKRILGG
jgi:type I restriction enzyme S subunit